MAQLRDVADHDDQARRRLCRQRLDALHGEIQMLWIERSESLVEEEGTKPTAGACHHLGQSQCQAKRRQEGLAARQAVRSPYRLGCSEINDVEVPIFREPISSTGEALEVIAPELGEAPSLFVEEKSNEPSIGEIAGKSPKYVTTLDQRVPLRDNVGEGGLLSLGSGDLPAQHGRFRSSICQLIAERPGQIEGGDQRPSPGLCFALLPVGLLGDGDDGRALLLPRGMQVAKGLANRAWVITVYGIAHAEPSRRIDELHPQGVASGPSGLLGRDGLIMGDTNALEEAP